MKRFLRNRITPIVVLALFSVKLVAQDKITFVWDAGKGDENVMLIQATINKSFTINWGDGTIEMETGAGNIGVYLRHTYTTTGRYEVTIVASNADCRFTSFEYSGSYFFNGTPYPNTPICSLTLAGCSALTALLVDNNQLINLDLSGCLALQSLNCRRNQLTDLDLSGCPALQDLDCSGNQFQLSELFAIHSFMENLKTGKYRKNLGIQNLPPQTAIVGEELFSEQSVFNAIFTEYGIWKQGNPTFPAFGDNYYTVVDGKLTFNEVGIYYVTMYNKAIYPNSVRPVAVEVVITVVKNRDILEKS